MIFRHFFNRALAIVVSLTVSIWGQSQPASPVGRTIPGRFIVAYRNAQVPADAGARALSAGGLLMVRHDRLGLAVVQSSVTEAATMRQRLALDPAVEWVAEDRWVAADALQVRAANAPSPTPDALYNGAQGWAVRQVGGFGDALHPGPWNVTTGKGIRIAILDSGVDATHPDLAANIALNLSEVDQSPATGLPSACDDGGPQDQQGHGTWTASLAAGAVGAETGLVAGVAPAATLLNIKVLERMPAAQPAADDPTGCKRGQAYGLLSWVIQGIEDAVTARADVISMSLGTLVDITTGDGAGLKALFDHVTHAAFEAGAILVASAGNDGVSLDNRRFVELPAQSRDVLAIVASTNPACAETLTAGATCAPGPVSLPYYSNSGAALNALASPGGSYPAGPDADSAQTSGWIWGACSSAGCFDLGHTTYVQAMGTSASAPLAAGAAALVRAANPTWDAATVVAALRKSAVQAGTLPVPQINVAGLLTATTAANDHHITIRDRQ